MASTFLSNTLYMYYESATFRNEMTTWNSLKIKQDVTVTIVLTRFGINWKISFTRNMQQKCVRNILNNTLIKY